MVKARLPIFSAILALALASARAGDLDTLGFTSLRALHPELTGAGQTVAQPEAGGTYQVNPSAVGQPAGLFRYYDSTHPYGGAGATFTSASNHANSVGINLYGATTGGAPGVQRVENFDADYFVNNIVIHLVTVGPSTTWQPVAIASPIVNQSFVFTETNPSNIATINAFYDAYVNAFGTLFVNGLNNGAGSLTNAPASMYNGIAVGRTDGVHSGRAQLVAPAIATSFATPWVSAAAVVLRQAAELGDFLALPGTDPTDSRVLKAGLLNGATKTPGWSHTSTDPLDPTYGSGVVNVHGAFDTLAGGQKDQSSTALIALGTIPTNSPFTAPIGGLAGWDLNSLTALTTSDAVAHYFFDLSNQLSLSLTATLTWDSIVSALSDTGDRINNFDLVLVNATTHAIAWSSVSTAYNVEQIYLTNLPSAKYDLQVILRGGTGTPSLSDNYAVAWSWTSTGPVPESNFVWVIGAAGFLFIVRKRLAARRARA
ncbi:MAG: hypothetical protein ACREKL_02100 [Chthoniobacterales bacterium]